MVYGYGFLSFDENMSKNIGKNTSKSLSGKYSPGMLAMRQKLLAYAKKSVTDVFKAASKRAIKKIAEASRDFNGNKIGIKITGVSKSQQQNNSETVTTEHDKDILKKDIYLQKIDKKLLMI